MKRQMLLMFALLLLLPCLSCAAADADSLSLRNYAIEIPRNIETIFYCADKALEDGMDPEQVRREMAELAEEAGLSDSVAYAAENLAAVGSEGYTALQAQKSSLPMCYSANISAAYETAVLDQTGFSAYSCPSCSEALKALLADAGAQYCTEPFLWQQRDFQEFYGIPYSSFQPSSPRPGYICLVISDSAQAWPEQSWGKENSAKSDLLYYSVKDSMNSLITELARLDRAPVITGNPDLASSFWVFDTRYTFRGYYGKSEIRGFNVTLSLTVVDAVSKNQIASVQRQVIIPDTISSWSNGIAAASLPDLLADDSDVRPFIQKVGAAIAKERASAAAERKITALNAASVVNGILANQAAKAWDAWQKAIYEAGARDVQLGNNTVSFSLRSFRAAPEGAYADAEDGIEWLRTALSATEEYSVTVTLPLSEGRLSDQALSTLSGTVSQAAQQASQSFAGADIQNAILGYYVPSAGQVGNWISEHHTYTGQADEAAWTALFEGVTGKQLGTWAGPHTMSLSFSSLNTEALLKKASIAAADVEAYTTGDHRYYDEELLKFFAQKLSEKAAALKWSDSVRFDLTIDIDDIMAGILPGDFTGYIRSFDPASTLEQLEQLVNRMPFEAAVSMPNTSMLTGSYSGVPANFRLSSDSEATYVLLRNTKSGQAVASGFIRAGGNLTLYAPAGEYQIVYCSGPYWYGEELLFSVNGVYNKSEPTELMNGYSHSFMLEPVRDGNLDLYSASPEDFR